MNAHEKHIRWLYAQLPALLEAGILDARGVAAVQQRYGPPAEGRDGRTLALAGLAALGSLLIGLGIILLFAYNWEGIPLWSKTALAFLPLVLSSSLAVFALARRTGSAAWSEGCSLAMALAAGACLALVSQIYQIGGDMESFCRTWLWMTLPLLFAFRSRSIFLLLCAMMALWIPQGIEWPGWADTLTFATVSGSTFWALRGFRKQTAQPLLLITFVISSGIGIFSILGELMPEWWPVWASAGFATVYLWERLSAREGFDSWMNRGMGVVALGIVVALTMALSFEELWRAVGQPRDASAALQATGLGVAATLAAVYGALLFKRYQEYGLWGIAWASAPVALLGATLLSDAARGAPAVAAMVANAYLFAVALLVAGSGLLAGRLARANRGLLALAILAVMRFFDSELGMLPRALGFLLLGSAFLAANAWMLKRRKELCHD